MRLPILYTDKSECCGCAACKAICPTGAIAFIGEGNGFSYPVVDQEKCIGCLACENVCAFKHDLKAYDASASKTGAYALTVREIGTLEASSSGGAFTCFSDCVLHANGAVACCIYNTDSHQLVFELVTNAAERDLARGSKYFQANSESIYGQIQKWLEENPRKRVMFVGTGCQVAGLHRYAQAKGIRDRLILVDLICNGVPSPGLWGEYACYLEQKLGKPFDSITFKDKTKGWEEPSQFAVAGLKTIELDAFSDWFYDGLTQRESCYVCPYTRLARSSDLTIGDFWGVTRAYPEAYDPRGVSLVLSHSQIGNELISESLHSAKIQDVDPRECLQPRLECPLTRPKERDRFWEEVKKRGIAHCIRRHKRDRAIGFLKRKIKGAARRVLRWHSRG